MHLDQERLHLLIEGKLSAGERSECTDHILACQACATRFRALNELRTSMPSGLKPARPIPLRYIVGVAAVLFMAIFPYTQRPDRPNSAVSSQITQQTPVRYESFNVLEKVDEINYRHALDSWGTQTNTLDLLTLKQKRS